ncbi:MAG: hypothetical protein AAGL49_00670 [Pseudomonadota bacterium]
MGGDPAHPRTFDEKPKTERGAHRPQNFTLGGGAGLMTVQTTRRDGASVSAVRAGHAPRKSFNAPARRGGWRHGRNLFALMNADDDLIQPRQAQPVSIDRAPSSVSYAGAHGRLRRCAERTAAEGQDAHVSDILDNAAFGLEPAILQAAYGGVQA